MTAELKNASSLFDKLFATVSNRFEILLNSNSGEPPSRIRSGSLFANYKSLAVLLNTIFSALFSLVNIGSTVALNQSLSLGLAALLSSCAISIFCIVSRRIRGSTTAILRIQSRPVGPPNQSAFDRVSAHCIWDDFLPPSGSSCPRDDELVVSGIWRRPDHWCDLLCLLGSTSLCWTGGICSKKCVNVRMVQGLE